MKNSCGCQALRKLNYIMINTQDIPPKDISNSQHRLHLVRACGVERNRYSLEVDNITTSFA